jgi:hypothetical protein
MANDILYQDPACAYAFTDRINMCMMRVNRDHCSLANFPCDAFDLDEPICYRWNALMQETSHLICWVWN